MIPFVPPPIRDESFYGLLSRIKVMMGIGASSMMLEIAFDRQSRMRRTAGLSPDLDLFARNLPPGCWLTQENLSDRFTSAPFFSRFVNRRMGFVSGETARVRAGGGSTTNLRFCPDCVVSDKASHGLATWRRTHQLRMVTVCPWHLSPLRLSAARKDSYWIVICPQDPDDGTEEERVFEPRLAGRLAASALWLCENPGSPLPEMRQVALRELGHRRPELVRNGLRVDRALLGSSLLAHAGRSGWAALGFSGDEATVSRKLGDRFGQGSCVHKPAFWSLLADLIGCQIQDFVQPDNVPPAPACAARAAVRSHVPNSSAAWLAKCRRSVEVRRTAYLEIIRLHPTMTRGACARANRTVWSFLRTHDRAWLEALPFPPASRGTPDSDRDYADHARSVAEALRAKPGRPVRVSPTGILTASPKAFGWLAICRLAHLPELDRALREEREDALAFGYRKMAWAIEAAVSMAVLPTWTAFKQFGGLRGAFKAGGERYLADLREAYGEVVLRWRARRIIE